MFGLKIFVRVQTFRRVPPVLPRNFCHPDDDYDHSWLTGCWPSEVDVVPCDNNDNAEDDGVDD